MGTSIPVRATQLSGDSSFVTGLFSALFRSYGNFFDLFLKACLQAPIWHGIGQCIVFRAWILYRGYAGLVALNLLLVLENGSCHLGVTLVRYSPPSFYHDRHPNLVVRYLLMLSALNLYGMVRFISAVPIAQSIIWLCLQICSSFLILANPVIGFLSGTSYALHDFCVHFFAFFLLLVVQPGLCSYLLQRLSSCSSRRSSLMKNFVLDNAWDSKHNLAFLAALPYARFHISVSKAHICNLRCAYLSYVYFLFFFCQYRLVLRDALRRQYMNSGYF